MAEPGFSLIVATRGRDTDVGVLLDSLLAQKRDDLEVIVVDQNADDRLGPILARVADRLPIRHLRSDRAHANHARNMGLRQARGAIVAFPDDDCILPPGVLDRVAAAFTDVTLAVLTGPAVSPEGELSSGRWRTDRGAITLANLWTSVIEFNLFLRRDVALAVGGFDERMGPGTPWGSAEGNDLVARAIRSGYRALYDPALRIIHPDKRLTPIAVERARLYGAGLGVALRRHAPGIRVWLPFFLRPLSGLVLAALKRNPLQVAYYLATFRGRLSGFLAREARS
jgi:glycosyltransferase involved in cell wall biosynthesis